MEDHETRRKIIREWMALPKDKRHTEEQVVAFAKKAIQKNEFHRSRRDPDHQFRRDPYQKLWDGFCLALGSRDRAQREDLRELLLQSLRVLSIQRGEVEKVRLQYHSLRQGVSAPHSPPNAERLGVAIFAF